MAYKPRAVDLKLREQRLQSYQTAQTVSARFPAFKHISLDLRFTGADRLSPYKQFYMGDMQAYFFLQCPSKDCDGGGFDLTSAVTSAAKKNAGPVTGQAQCTGFVAGSSRRGDPCPVQLSFEIDCAPRD